MAAGEIAAQKPSAPSNSAGPASGVSTSTLGATTTNRNSPINSTSNSGDLSRPIFLSGSVLFDDGTPPNTDVRIERVCRGNPRLESHTDSKGHFSFQVGGPSSFNQSATDASYSGGSNSNGSNSAYNPFGASLPASAVGTTSVLMDCELRAAYPGYRSDSVQLGSRHSMDDPEVGTIVLHRLANVKGTTISLTSSLAPKAAQKDFAKGMQAAQKGKYEEAEGKLQEATKEYPKYAEAWFQLGQVQEKLNKNANAAEDYTAAINADAKFVSPYDRLARLSASSTKWEDAEKYSKEAIDLNPVEFPSSFWYNALANYNLKRDAEAEKSARSLVKLDRAHAYPDAERMLADLTSARGDLAEAADHLKAYLDEAPAGKSAEQARKQLARIEQAKAAQASNQPK
jgi:tetratricopeptide (TPR) repeat protein